MLASARILFLVSLLLLLYSESFRSLFPFKFLIFIILLSITYQMIKPSTHSPRKTPHCIPEAKATSRFVYRLAIRSFYCAFQQLVRYSNSERLWLYGASYVHTRITGFLADCYMLFMQSRIKICYRNNLSFYCGLFTILPKYVGR